MSKKLILAAVVALGLIGNLNCARAGLFDDITAAKNKVLSVTNLTSTNTAALNGISQDQMVQALKDALTNGLQHAVSTLGHTNGFLTNSAVKIPMPAKLLAVEKTLRAMKQDKYADDFINTMNHAAEQAVPQAISVFGSALAGMSVDDAKQILAGPTNAATVYFQNHTQTNLYTKFYPIVQTATAATGVTAAYKKLLAEANTGGSFGGFGSKLTSFMDKDSLDIDGYVTNEALVGLFKMVANEEYTIRTSAAARTTDALKTVFGALQQ